MIRSVVLTVILAGGGLFGYYFLTDRSERPNGDKARDAAVQVGDAAKDTGAAVLVQARLTARFGMDAMRYLHVRYDDGAVVVYGLAPRHVAADALVETVRAIPGVTSVQALIHELPESMTRDSAHGVAAAPSEQAPAAPPKRPR